MRARIYMPWVRIEGDFYPAAFVGGNQPQSFRDVTDQDPVTHEDGVIIEGDWTAKQLADMEADPQFVVLSTESNKGERPVRTPKLDALALSLGKGTADIDNAPSREELAVTLATSLREKRKGVGDGRRS